MSDNPNVPPLPVQPRHQWLGEEVRTGSDSSVGPPMTSVLSPSTNPLPPPQHRSVSCGSVTNPFLPVDDGAFNSQISGSQVFPDGEGSVSLTFNSVVRIFVTRQIPDYGNPWMTMGTSTSSGSGIVIKTKHGNRPLMILTAAHVVANHTFLQVQRCGRQDPNKYVAKVYAMSDDCDLALLSVDASEPFWEELRPAVIGDIPSLRSVILVAGFPVGGEQLSITEGVVSRIEGQTYWQSYREGLAITVDATINSGNSGGPVFDVAGHLVGIAFQVINMASNHLVTGNGHVIPPPILHHFLDGVAKSGPDGGYRGIPSLGLEMQELTNPNLRKHFGLEKHVNGVLVTKVWHQSTCEGLIEPHDVLVSVDGAPVANNETVVYQDCGRIKVPIIFQMAQCGDTVPLGIIRKGQEMVVNVVAKPETTLVARSGKDRWPVYFVYCGLVFQRLSMKYIDQVTPGFPHYERLAGGGKLMTKDWRQVVILSKVLSDEVNVGYEYLRLEQIKKINGSNVPDFEFFVKAVERTETPYMVLETCCGEQIILPSPSNPESKIANQRVMDNYHVGVDRRMEKEYP